MDDELWVPPIAARQCGAFTRRQAFDAGVTPSQLRWRIRRGVWVPVLGSVLRGASWPADEFIQAHAARLTWPECVVAFRTAARLHGLPVRDDRQVHVVVPSGRPARGGLRPYQYRLDDGDVTEVLGVRATTRRRTILDCLGRLPESESLDLLAWVSSRRLATADDLSRWVADHPGRWGNQRRAAAALRLVRGAVNPAEDRLHKILRRAGITGWVAGAHLDEYLGLHAQADVYFPDVRLVVEFDGRAAHGADRFQSDRTRQNRLVAAGCTILRYTWADLVGRPSEVAAEIQATLARLRRQLA